MNTFEYRFYYDKENSKYSPSDHEADFHNIDSIKHYLPDNEDLSQIYKEISQQKDEVKVKIITPLKEIQVDNALEAYSIDHDLFCEKIKTR